MTWTTRRRSDHGPLAAITAGDGPLVLLIHGVGLRAESWGAQIDALAQDYRVLAVDMPGHGHSAPLGYPAQLSDFTNAIAMAFDGSAYVIGHSFGAMIALDMAVRYPDRVRAVAALNAIFQRDEAAKTAVQARASSLDGVTVADPGATLTRWFGADASPQRAACEGWLRAVDPAGYKAAYSVFATEDGPSEAALSSLRRPALFLTGADEPNSTPAMSQRMAELAPNGRAEIVAGAAHMLPMTHAAHLNASLRDFLQGAAP